MTNKKTKILTFAGIFLSGIPIFISYYLANNYKDEFIQKTERHHIALISDMQVGFKEFSLKHSTLISHMITSSNPSNDQIQSYIKNEYKKLDQLGLDQIQIIDENGISVARVNDTHLIGQNLIHRPLVKKALETGVVEEWFESGLVRSGYRFVYPVIQEDKIKYLIEFVLSIQEIERRLKALHGESIDILMPSQFTYSYKEFDSILPIKDSDGHLYAFSVYKPSDESINQLFQKIKFTQNTGIALFVLLLLFFLLQNKITKTNEKKIIELHKERKIFDNGPVMLFHWNNSPGWPVSYISKTVENILGYKDDYILSSEFVYSDIIHQDDKDRIANQVKYHVESSQDKYKQEYRIKKSDGSFIYVTDYTYVIRDEYGYPIKFIGYLVDQSEYIDKDYQLLLADIIINESDEVIVLADKDGNVTYVNESFNKVCGKSKPKRMLDIFPDIDLSKSWNREIEYINSSGKKLYFSTGFSIIEKDQKIRLLLIFRDITAIKEANERFTYIATHDLLTQAKNKSAIWFDILGLVQKQEPFSAINVQINNLKKSIDIYGHLFGDSIVKTVYARIFAYSDNKDLIIARQEDKQFIIIAKTDNENKVNNIVSDIYSSISEPVIINDTFFSIDASLGSLIFPRDLTMPDNIVFEETANDIIRLVSIAVDIAHKENKHYLSYDNTMLEAIQLKEERIKKIDESIKNGFQGLHMVYQPKYHCSGDIGSSNCHNLVGFEALLQCDYMPLPYLLSISEENGKILDIGRFVIERVICDVKSWINDGFNLDNISVSFNVSAIQLSNQDVGQIISNSLTLNNIDGRLFEMEITESKIIENFDKVKKVIDDVKKLGIKVSIDDFGTGYSNLRSLLEMHVDTIKIDRSFVQNMDHSHTKQAIIQTIITMASSMNATTIAEGVERAEEVDVLIRAGNRNFQGYFFDRPLEIEDVKDRLKKRLTF